MLMYNQSFLIVPMEATDQNQDTQALFVLLTIAIQ